MTLLLQSRTLLAGASSAWLLFATPTPAKEIAFISSFECGNGTDFVEVEADHFEYRMEKDSNSTDSQWFYFEVQNAAEKTLTFTMVDTDETNVRGHWQHAVPVFSTDGGDTFSHITSTPSATDETYTFTHDFTTNSERIAFHFPYPWTQIDEEIKQYATHPQITHEVLGQSVQGRDIHYLRISNEQTPNPNKPAFWIVARQHAAEVTGSFKMDGFMQFITSDDPDAVTLRENSIIHVAPCANPDGVFIGNYRDNAAGINLNRVWDGSANMNMSPEVFLIEQKIEETISDNDGDYVFMADLHSTSGSNPHFAFHAGASQVPELYPTPETYHTDSRRYLALVEDQAQHFNPTQGASSSTDTRLCYHNERIDRGVLSFTFEGGYIRQYHGANPQAFMTPELHREVGVAMGRALVEYYELGK